MTYERWQDIVDRVTKQSPGATTGKEDLPEGPGHCEFIEFASPLGKMRLELWVRPQVVEKKTLYSHRMHSAATVQYRYNESEHTLTLYAYRWDDTAGDWQEVNAASLAQNL
ncbi:MAG: hypothetical protein U1C53_03255 [Candidatus Veblenbacteria bacterium]|nr:hypothetical protein [Candidatus Veblenbacteria bacterium]MDZ4230132.1 hypothetical protein [Candidatus Veblenbacteria bacterium]